VIGRRDGRGQNKTKQIGYESAFLVRYMFVIHSGIDGGKGKQTGTRVALIEQNGATGRKKGGGDNRKRYEDKSNPQAAFVKGLESHQRRDRKRSYQVKSTGGNSGISKKLKR